ncbi:MAG: hypothetical protein MR589_05285, partial [Lachnobacterium sp.]|nr:hypothetical protein [Lachnobacterium sp.]
LANDKDGWAYYLEALCHVLEIADNKIAPDRSTFEKNPYLLGYKGSNDLFYIKADSLEQMVKNYLVNKDKAFCFLNNQKAFSLLANDNLIKVYNNGSGKHCYTVGAKRSGVSNRLVAIYMDRLRDEVIRLS